MISDNETTLGTVCDLQIGGTPSRNIPRFWGVKGEDFPWVSISDMITKYLVDTKEYITETGIKFSNVKLVPCNSLLMSFKLSIGRVAFTDVDLYTNEAIVAIFPRDSKVDIRWLYYFLPLLIQGNLTDVAVKGQTLNKNKLANIVLHLPSIDEQRRIADILDAADAAIEQTDTLIAKLRLMRAGLLHDLLTCGVDANGELRDPAAHPEQFADTALGRLPKEWIVKKVSDIGSTRIGRQRAPQHQTGQFQTQYLRVANVFDGWIDYSDTLSMNFTPEERKAYNLIQGDILLNEGQSLELVGRSAIFDGSPNIYCFQNTLIRFRCFGENNPRFYQPVFKYWLDNRVFTLVAKQTTSVAHLGGSRFADMLIMEPLPDEQNRIAKILDAHDARIRTEEAYSAKLRQIKQGLMDDLLSGRVRV